MVRIINDFRDDPPVIATPGQNAMGYGFNPFMSGQFGNYFGNQGGGVPDASSGYRYRNKKDELTNSLTPDKSVEELGGINKEIDTLNADRNSYVGTGLASGLSGAVGSVLGIVQNTKGINRLNGVNPESYISQESRDVAAEADQASNSSATPNRNQRISDINANTNAVVGNAQLTARTPEEVQYAVLAAQKNANNAINQEATQGAYMQKDNKRYSDSLNMKLGDMRQGVKNLIEQKKSEHREARTRNAAELATNLGITALTMGL